MATPPKDAASKDAGPKDPDAFRTISEVAEELVLPQHVLRFWETKFAAVKPMKRGGGRRYYRPDDVALLRGIQFLLYSEGYTIKGVQRMLKARGAKAVADAPEKGVPSAEPALESKEAVPVPAVVRSNVPAGPDALRRVLHELLECKRLLDQAR